MNVDRRINRLQQPANVQDLVTVKTGMTVMYKQKHVSINLPRDSSALVAVKLQKVASRVAQV